MITRILALGLALSTVTIPLEAGLLDTVSSYFLKSNEQGPPKIKVLTAHDKVGAILEVKGKYKLYDPHTGEHISTRFIGKRKFVQAVGDGIKWGEEFPGVYQIMVVPDETTSTVMVDGIEYHGRVYVYDIGGTISVVNQISIEEYLSSILGPQIKKPLADEALAAVVIAARTDAYYNIAHSPSDYWNVNAESVGYQGFVGVNPSSEVANTIESTKYMVMSKSPVGSKEIAPFPLQWKGLELGVSSGILSAITLDEANEMANKGEHAAQILAKAFPNTRIELVYNSDQ